MFTESWLGAWPKFEFAADIHPPTVADLNPPPRMKNSARLPRFGLLTLLFPLASVAQTSPTPPPTPPSNTSTSSTTAEAPVSLSAFEVNSTKDSGYRVQNAVATTGIAQALIDTPL